MLTLKSNMSEGVMKVDVYFTVFIKLIPKTSRRISLQPLIVSFQISYYAEKLQRILRREEVRK